MAVLNLLFSTISLISNILTFVVFKCSAVILILAIQALKVPGQAIHGLLKQVTDTISSLRGYLIDLLMDAIKSVISGGFDLLAGVTTGSLSYTISAIGMLVEKTRTALGDFVEILPEVWEGAAEMTGSVVSSLWENSIDAIEYIREHI